MGRYHIVTTWRVPGTVEEVAAVLGDVEALPRWWPSVYLDAEEREPGDAQGVGKVVALRTKGWLPYTLAWEFRVTEVDPGTGSGGRVVLEPRGDFTGRGEWALWQEGTAAAPVAVARYDWDVVARKPLIRALTPLLRPLLAANHDWAMRRGEESLRLELARRRAASAAERARVPPPPGPSRLTFKRRQPGTAIRVATRLSPKR